MIATAIYRALIAEVERRRIEQGWTCLELDAAAGLHSGYWAKCCHPDAPSGRQIRWEMLEFVMGALFPDGYDLAVKARKGPLLSAARMRFYIKAAAPIGSRTLRDHLHELASKGGKARKAKTTVAHRRRVARKAAKARWKRQKFKHAPTIG